MSRSELLFQLQGEKLKQFAKLWPEFPMCSSCGYKLLARPKAQNQRVAHKKPHVDVFWCDNCFISMKKGIEGYRYFGDKQFCNFCSASNYTRYSSYLRAAAFFEREPDPEALVYRQPTHQRTCERCKESIGVGGAYFKGKFYCLRHAPQLMGIPPIRILEHLHYPELA